MSVRTQIDRIKAAKDDIATAIAEKGVTVPSETLIDGMAGLIAAIESGGGLPDGVSALATGTITPTNDTSAASIMHNLGVKPDFAILMLDKATDTAADTTMALYSVLIYSPITLPNGTTYYALGYRHGVNSNGSLAGNNNNDSTGNSYPATETTVYIPLIFSLKAGHTYRWICGVIDSIN